MPTDQWRFDEYVLDVLRTNLTRAGVAIPLRPQSFELLRHLVARAGHPVAKDQLVAAVWHGAAVDDETLNRALAEARTALGRIGPETLKVSADGTVMFDASVVHVAEGIAEHPAAAPAAPSAGSAAPPALRLNPKTLRWAGIAAAALVCIVIAVIALRPKPVPPRQPLVVLPLAPLGSDVTQEPLADALTAELTTALTRVRGLNVAAPASAAAFKGQALDPRRLERELHVRYALEGSTLGTDTRLQIKVRLVDTTTGGSLWSEQFDVANADRAKTIELIVQKLAHALNIELAARAGDALTAAPAAAQS